MSVVFAGAKILIFQQITTDNVFLNVTKSCFCWCKDTNFSANHNCPNYEYIENEVVFAGAKILIFQQITTNMSRANACTLLFLLVQRY